MDARRQDNGLCIGLALQYVEVQARFALTLPFAISQSHANESRSAAQTSLMRISFKFATRLPRRSCEIVTALCKFTAQGPFIPSSTPSATSEGTSRIVEVIGAIVTVERWPNAPSRVSINTGRCLSGFSNRQRWTAPRFNLPAKPLHPPRVSIPLSSAV